MMIVNSEQYSFGTIYGQDNASNSSGSNGSDGVDPTVNHRVQCSSDVRSVTCQDASTSSPFTISCKSTVNKAESMKDCISSSISDKSKKKISAILVSDS